MKKAFFLRLFALLLALLTMAAVFTGCVSEKGPEKDTLPPETEGTPESELVHADLPDLTFDGYTYTVLHWYLEGWESRKNMDIYAESVTGDPINDVVYTRNTRLTQKYDFEIDYSTELYNEVISKMRSAVATNDDLYDLVYARLVDVPSVVVEGDCLDFETAFEYVDLDKPYWDQNIRHELSFGGRNYLMASSYNVTDEDATAGMAFNKRILADNGVTDVYALASAGNWTFDTLEDIMQGFESDVNGDGKLVEDEDVFSFLGGSDVATSFFFGGSGRLTVKDNWDYPEYVFSQEDNINVFTRVCDIMYEPNFLNHHAIANTDSIYYRQLFIDGHGLFFWMRMDDARAMRGEESIDFGILPSPKYDESQNDYISMISRHTTGFMSVLSCELNPDIVGFIMEAMAAASHYDLTHAYYDVTLKTKSARDDESQEMLDLIFAHRMVDIGEVMNFGGFATTMQNYMTKNPGKYNIVSAYASDEQKIASAVEEFIGKIEKIGG